MRSLDDFFDTCYFLSAESTTRPFPFLSLWGFLSTNPFIHDLFHVIPAAVVCWAWLLKTMQVVVLVWLMPTVCIPGQMQKWILDHRGCLSYWGCLWETFCLWKAQVSNSQSNSRSCFFWITHRFFIFVCSLSVDKTSSIITTPLSTLSLITVFTFFPQPCESNKTKSLLLIQTSLAWAVIKTCKHYNIIPVLKSLAWLKISSPSCHPALVNYPPAPLYSVASFNSPHVLQQINVPLCLKS